MHVRQERRNAYIHNGDRLQYRNFMVNSLICSAESSEVQSTIHLDRAMMGIPACMDAGIHPIHYIEWGIKSKLIS